MVRVASAMAVRQPTALERLAEAVWEPPAATRAVRAVWAHAALQLQQDAPRRQQVARRTPTATSVAAVHVRQTPTRARYLYLLQRLHRRVATAAVEAIVLAALQAAAASVVVVPLAVEAALVAVASADADKDKYELRIKD